MVIILSTQSCILTTLKTFFVTFWEKEKMLELVGNILVKGENAGKQHFLLIPECFLPTPEQKPSFGNNLSCLL